MFSLIKSREPNLPAFAARASPISINFCLRAAKNPRHCNLPRSAVVSDRPRSASRRRKLASKPGPTQKKKLLLAVLIDHRLFPAAQKHLTCPEASIASPGKNRNILEFLVFGSAMNPNFNRVPPTRSALRDWRRFGHFCCRSLSSRLHHSHNVTNRTTIRLAILALSALALPAVVNSQQQPEPVSGGLPLSSWVACLDNRFWTWPQRPPSRKWAQMRCRI